MKGCEEEEGEKKEDKMDQLSIPKPAASFPIKGSPQVSKLYNIYCQNWFLDNQDYNV